MNKYPEKNEFTIVESYEKRYYNELLERGFITEGAYVLFPKEAMVEALRKKLIADCTFDGTLFGCQRISGKIAEFKEVLTRYPDSFRLDFMDEYRFDLFYVTQLYIASHVLPREYQKFGMSEEEACYRSSEYIKLFTEYMEKGGDLKGVFEVVDTLAKSVKSMPFASEEDKEFVEEIHREVLTDKRLTNFSK